MIKASYYLYPTLAEASKAAQKLGIKTAREYRACYKDDPYLPSNPLGTYLKEWISWPEFLGTVRDYYSTLAEASKAAQTLGIKKYDEYCKRYKEDPRLPLDPRDKYPKEWNSWPEFLGTARDYYSTLAKASKAAQTLGIKTSSEYKKRYREDPRLPSRLSKKYSKEWVSWPDFLGTVVEYSTLVEASKAAQLLGIKIWAEYRKRYKEDPLLPSDPLKTYPKEWISWPEFLGTVRDYYSTLAEASKAAQTLGIKKYDEYCKRYKEDPRLPSDPRDKYPKEWNSWPEFLGTAQDYYSTLAEASKAAQKLGIKKYAEYSKRYKEDPHLPGYPRKKYPKEWISWPKFLGTAGDYYSTLSEASQAAQALGIENELQYKKRYKEDSRLPYVPRKEYPKEWAGFAIFLGTLIPKGELLDGVFWGFSERCPEWKAAAEVFIEEGLRQSAKILHLRPLLSEVIIPSGYTRWPGDLLNIENPFPKKLFEDYVNNTGESGKQVRYNICRTFFDWLLEKYCSEENDSDELIRLPGFRNPVTTLMSHLAEQFQHNRPSESVRPVLPMSVIVRAREHLIPHECLTFADLAQRHAFLEDAWFEVDPSVIDKDDPDCIWRERVIDRKPKNEPRYKESVVQIWSPVKLVALYTLLMVPLRGQQICWLDSGEADAEIPIIRGLKVEWAKNTLPLSGYERKQSFIKKYPDSQIGMYVTTNKTGGRSYQAPYMPYNLAYWIIRLRDWQAKYNPLDALTPWAKIKLRQRINKNVLKARGSQTFLFRDPCQRSTSRDKRYSPIITITAYSRALPALLAAIQRPGEGIAKIDPQFKTRTEYISEFTAHSLRTSIITALIVDGGAPVEVVMKLVGHATIVMTLYYTKVGPSRMAAELEDAQKRALLLNVDRLKDLAFTKQIETAKVGLIATDSEFFGRIDSDWPAIAYQFMDWGMCPMSGQGCDDGGLAIVERHSETLYAPVESGYLGKRNCPRCRFFISGPAFLGGLQALANEISLEINTVSAEYNDLLAEQERLENDRFDAEREGRVFENMKALNQTISVTEERGHKLNVFLTDWQHVFRLVRQSLSLINNDNLDGDDEKQKLIINEQFKMDMAIDETTSEFRLLASICRDAEIYQSASSSRALPKLAQMIDTFAENNGFSPGLYKLTEQQQRSSVNQVASLLLKRFDCDWSLTEQVVLGNLTLSDLNAEEALVPLRADIARALSGGNNSLKILGVNNVKS